MAEPIGTNVWGNEVRSNPRELIAIVGMGCRWPGGVRNTSQLWELLKNEKDGWSDFSADRINVDGFYHPDGQRLGSMYTRGGFLLEEDTRLFDHSFFGITAKEVLSMDPSQRKLLEVTYEAFDNAGQPIEKISGSKTGVFVGNFNNEHQIMQFRDPDHTLPYVVTGGGPTILSNRISYVFNLQGPSLVVDTACSASMYALHLAVISIQNGDCDSAIVAGGNLILGPDSQLFTTKLGAVSPTSRCHTFDIAADGYARAEGFGALYIKRLSDAIADGDPIRAVIRGTAYNANGKTGGISHPNPDGQEAVIRHAYRVAGNLNPSETGYFECHGTGTPVGDPIEVSAVGRVFAGGRHAEPLLIGSIKPNLGHSEAASAMSQIMKSVLAMEHEHIPATIGIKTFNPAIDFATARVKVSIAGRNESLDNGDLASDLFPPRIQRFTKLLPTKNAGSREVVIIPFSAHDESALSAAIASLSSGLKRLNIADTLYTLTSRKSRFAHRAVIIQESVSLCNGFAIDSVTYGKAPSTAAKRVGFLFTGQGAQWPKMGTELLKEYGVFRQAIRYLDYILAQLQCKPDWTIETELQKDPSTSKIQDAEFSQTICTALQIAMVQLLRQWDVLPAVTVGHSSGEIAAAYAAGHLRACEAIILAYCRGIAMSSNKRKGLMIAVGLGPESILVYLDGIVSDVRLAAINSPESVTISGETTAIEELATRLNEDGVFNRVLKTGGNAYHSHMIDVGESYEDLCTQSLDDIKHLTSHEAQLTQICWISSVDACRMGHSPPVSYWRRNLESTVSFSPAMEFLSQNHPVDLLIEVGPHPALAGSVKQIRKYLEESQQLSLPQCFGSLFRDGSDIYSMLQLAGNLFIANFPVNMTAVNATETEHGHRIQLQHGLTCVDLPQYNFTYPKAPLYFENRFSREYRTRKHLRHDLLGARQPGCSKSCPSWRNVLRVTDLPWLADHKLIPHTILPASAYLAMAVEAISQLHGETKDGMPIKRYKLRNVAINSTLQIMDGEFGAELFLNMEQVVLADADTESLWYKFTVSSVYETQDNWTTHCRGYIAVETEQSSIGHANKLLPHPRARLLDVSRWYNRFEEIGLGYGKTFRALSGLRAHRSSNVVAADVFLNPTAGLVQGGESSYVLHPASLDSCLQLALISVHSGQVEHARSALVPVGIQRMSIWVPNIPHDLARATASGRKLGLRSAYAQVQLHSPSGQSLLEIEELKCVSYGNSYDTDPVKSGLIREPYWRPVFRADIASMTTDLATTLFPPKEIPGWKLYLLDEYCAYALVASIESAKDNKLAQTNQRRHSAFLSWFELKTTTSPLLSYVIHQKHSERKKKMRAILLDIGSIPEVKCIQKIFSNQDDIFLGVTDSKKLLLENDLLLELETSGLNIQGAHGQLQNLVDLLAHKNPHMRILEVGCGMGGATAAVLSTLDSNYSFKRYESYDVTDPAGWCLSNAKLRFEEHRHLTFRELNIQQDPLAQGFSQQNYDLIIASKTLDATQNVSTGLANIQKLIRPGGRLVIMNGVYDRLGPEVIHRALTGNWTIDSRTKEKFCLNRCLIANGFSGTDISLDDYAGEKTLSNILLSTALPNPDPASMNIKNNQDIHIIYREYLPPVANAVAARLRGLGFNCIYTNMLRPDLIPDESLIISFTDMESGTLLHRDEEHLISLQSIVARSLMLLCIASKGADVRAPETAVQRAMLRSIVSENVSLKAGFIEIHNCHDSCMERATEIVQGIFLELWRCSSAERVDREYSIDHGVAYIERLLPESVLNDEFCVRNGLKDNFVECTLQSQNAFKACYEQPGLLSSLYFATDLEFEKPLDEGWICIETKAIGLNMKDLSIATARFDAPYMSCETAGIVREVGPGVTSLQPGDGVFGMALGGMGNFTRMPAQVASRIPDKESFVNAASMPVSFLAALYSLDHLARLQPGESVLIQSAAGAFGIAAIQVARTLGAKIYATVSTDEKRMVLVKQFGIEPLDIFNSRSLSSINDIMERTQNKGIDVVLSTASGDLMHETWRCISPLGRFIDVGRRDVLGGGSLAMEVFKRNATFCSFDLCIVYEEKPEVIARLMDQLLSLWSSGAIRPFKQLTTFCISQLEVGMSMLAKGIHAGKIVITFDDPKSLLKVRRHVSRTNFVSNAVYVMVGCLGGLGRSLAAWMVERGARQLVFLSRSALEKSESADFITELSAMGATATHYRCDVTDLDSLTTTIRDISSTSEVRGVIHAGMVTGDSWFNQTTYELVQSVLAPKLTGTVNLHYATKHLPLDFFLLTSSITGVIGTPAQAAYAAGNAFQDAFARFRHEQGLPATALALGLIQEVGSISNQPGIQQQLQRNATYGISETEFLQLLDGAMCQSQLSQLNPSDLVKLDPSCVSQILTGFEPGRFIPYVAADKMKEIKWHNNSRFQYVMRAILESADESHLTTPDRPEEIVSSPAAQLQQASSAEEKLVVVRHAITSHIASLLNLDANDIDCNKPMTEYGIDSLVAAELRNWLIRTFGVVFTLLQLLSKLTQIEEIVVVIATGCCEPG
ncbi:hypothetical protein QQS21_000819 [Conoideocrella luteorostrata]|uniref:Polyketide synthase n=1 Tax=Conoideocrella luteorostrata TaxID=1105319 RepID=A0AAJ0CY59_9HYPO|nr:hypothetical protein QQS21_000819 [Conoideocrella luteorostrata]